MDTRYIFNRKSKTHWLNLFGAVITALTAMEGVIPPEYFPVVMGTFVGLQHFVRGLTNTAITAK